ncbi:conserved hypothetical protein [Delftia acidovorans SPH-1]|uniref:Bacteriophage phiJL001 Gp84 C-terminal domain-containing protein n=1 Tax=Delftia acidovorans (strain DSM 14801 / SPH-1) TaxID=398578 RepID=A9C0E7_DELAS|nr:DUF2163 domain-containing protein [Delftia acidovorans]ABX36713.1 conserved hypothetical protein [Delftia acidovorans SPH-1]QPS74037.1 DUF2163 domain-containing protein [Delftia acidovorans]
MRIIPIALQEHLDGDATTVCLLVRIEPVAPGFDPVGVTTLDRDVLFDAGTGALLYRAAVGVDSSARVSSSDMAVDNAEGTSLVPEFDVPVSERDLVAGAYDYARWTSYLVNFEDTTQFVELARGELGQVRVSQGMSFTFEMLGLTKRLKQTVVEKDSLRCRAIFGSQPLGTPGATVTQLFYCGREVDGLFVGSHVVAPGEENTVSFSTALSEPDGYFKPGMLRWVTGANAGRVYEVEEHKAGVLSLTFGAMFPVQAGDEFRVRPDCTKWKDGPNGCKHWFGANWVLHYRGEPYIPVGDTGQINAPGASV